MELPEILNGVVDSFSKIPGVGEKTALRQALILSRWSEAEIQGFANSVQKLNELKKCEKCGMLSDESLCQVCSDPSRGEVKTLCVIEAITDCLAIERSQQFNGRYHILGGVLNPLIGIGPDELNIDGLVTRVKKEGYDNIILAVNPSVEGDATCSYIKQVMPDGVNVDRIGFGVPMGGSLEYLDSMTISKALENKKRM